MRLAVVTDTTAYIPEELLKKHNIYTVPLSVVFGDTSYREGIDISTEEFYKKVREEENLPTTSQPSIGTMIELYEGLSKEYDEVISIHLSKKFSGTYESAKSAAEMVDNIKVHVFDSETSAMPQGFYVLKAAEMAIDGKGVEEILTHLDDMKIKTEEFFIVDDLSHLKRGGRLNGAQALVGSLLNIKPILHVEEGLIVPYEKIRTRKKALQRVMSMLEADVKEKNVRKVVFIHANMESSAIELRNEFSVNHPEIETIISYFGPVLGTHLGEGTLGVSWYTE